MVAAPYCFGPTSKLLCVAEELCKRHELVFFGNGPGITLAEDTFFERVICVSDRDRWDAASLSVLERVDALASFLDYRCLPLAAAYGVPSLFFDTLLWLRRSAPPHVNLASRYVAQAFFTQRSSACPLDVETVGPVLPMELDGVHGHASAAPYRSVLLVFGGLRSPVMLPRADVQYVRRIVDIMDRACIPGIRITACVPSYVSASIPLAAYANIQIRTPHRSEFYALLAESDLVVTVPGVEAVFEALSIAKPIVFLPPYNGTQFHQGRTYRTLNLGLLSLWPTFLNALDCDSDDLTLLTRQIQTHSLAGEDAAVTRDCIEKLRHIFTTSYQNPERLLEWGQRGRALLTSLGTPGRHATAEAVEALFGSGTRAV